MKRVLFRAPVLTQSGYGVHARQVLKWLKAKEEQGKIAVQIQVLPWGDTPWYINSSCKDGLVGWAMQRTDSLKAPYDVTIQLQLPNEWDPSLGNFNVGMSAAVETTVAPSQWVDACNKMQKIIVPSKHAESSLRSACPIATQIDIVPESYIESIDKESLDTLNIPLSDEDFCVLVHAQITGNNVQTDRKNIYNTVKWLCELVNDKSMSNMCVVLKTNTCRNSKIDRLNTLNAITSLLAQARRGKSPKVILLHGDMSDDESAALYVHPQVKALVSLTRGEGFGLPLLEAAASGLPVVATNWSAHTEFLHDKFIPVDYKLVDVHKSKIDNKIFVQGSKWAEPSELDFKIKMKSLVSNYDSHKTVAHELSEQLKDTHSFSSICRVYDKTLGEILI